MHDVHGIANLPGVAVPESAGDERANKFVPRYFAEYESRFQLPVVRPVVVETVRDAVDGRLDVITDHGSWNTAAIINATGTWNRPFIPWYPGIETFHGRQLHTSDYRGAEQVDAVLLATGFRADLAHLAPLHLRERSGGIRMDGTRTVVDPRVHLVGYGPSASTIGGNRGGFA